MMGIRDGPLSGERYPVRRRKRQMQTIVTTIISRNGPLDKKSNLNMFVSKFDQISRARGA